MYIKRYMSSINMFIIHFYKLMHIKIPFFRLKTKLNLKYKIN